MNYLAFFVCCVVIPALNAEFTSEYDHFAHDQQGNHGAQGEGGFDSGDFQHYGGFQGHNSQVVDHTYEVTKPVRIPVYKLQKVPIPYAVPVPMPKPVVVPIAQPYTVQILVPHAIPVPVVKTINFTVEKQVPVPVVKEVPFKYDKPVPVHVDVPRKYPVYVPVYKHIYLPAKGKQETQVTEVKASSTGFKGWAH